MSSHTPAPGPAPARFGLAGRMAAMFIDSRLTPIAVAASLLLGLFAVLMLPREEEPQIKVPMVNVLVGMPGSTAAEVENLRRPLRARVRADPPEIAPRRPGEQAEAGQLLRRQVLARVAVHSSNQIIAARQSANPVAESGAPVAITTAPETTEIAPETAEQTEPQDGVPR